MRSNIEKGVVEGYNSRPRDMINNVLQDIQKRNTTIEKETLLLLLDTTLILKRIYGGVPNADYVIDTIMPFVDLINTADGLINLESVFSDSEIMRTLEKSPATTSNVNRRLCLARKLLMEK